MMRTIYRCGLFSIAVGVWLAATSLTFGVHSSTLSISDLCAAAGALLCGILGVLQPQRRLFIWTLSLIGAWLEFAPLLFWAPSAVHYLNDTFCGILLILLSFTWAAELEPQETGSHIPRGWSFNPSGFPARTITSALALLCWMCSRYLAAYQLGYIDTMWDPFFLNGSLDVITSQISQDFPVSDAGLGAFSYTLEFLLGWQGDSRRWRTMPWLVILFGVLVVPASLVSIILIILQPVAVGAWCSWCLATAVLMLLMILFSGSEILAAIGCVREAAPEGKSCWYVLWRGKQESGQSADLPARNRAWGFSPCWNLSLLILLGLYLMVSPNVWSHEGMLSTLAYILGPLMITFACISMVEVYRTLRFVAGFLGIILLLASCIWRDPNFWVNGNLALIGLLASLLSWPRGPIRERYGIWNRLIV